MKSIPSSMQTLALKSLIIVLPIITLFGISTLATQTPTYAKLSLLEDKIQRLVITATTSPRIIVAGESQAEADVVPNILQKLTGLPAVNVSVGNGTLNEIYDALLRSTALSQQKKLLIIGVNSYEINDHYDDNQILFKKIIGQMPFGIEKLRYEYKYYHALALFYLNNFKNFIRLNIRDTGHMDAATFARGGNSSNTAILQPHPLETTDPNDPWYTDIKTGGLKQEAFVTALTELGKTPHTIVIYIAPIAPSRRASLAGIDVPTETNFIHVIRTTIAPYPNMHFFDFRSEPIPTLTDTEFMDYFHLNDKGATIFTTLLSKHLREDSIIK